MTNSILFAGVMSSGKDVSAGKFLRYCLERKPRRVIANCWLNVKDVPFERLTTEQLYEMHSDQEFFRDSYLYISEIHLILESRSSTSLMNKNFTSNFLTQIGKLNCKIIMTTQLTGSVDIRMREWTPYRIICKRLVYRNGKYQEPDFFDDRKLKEQIYIEWTLNFTDLDDKEIYIPLGLYAPIQEDFDFFDTEEMFYVDREKYMRR